MALCCEYSVVFDGICITRISRSNAYEQFLVGLDEVRDVYCLSQCMYCVGEYERAAIFIKNRGLHEKFNAFR